MKRPLLFFAILLLTKAGYAQLNTKYRIETQPMRYSIPGIVDVVSMIPQLNGGLPARVKETINKDIRSHFRADIRDDSAHYVQKLLAEYDVSTIEEYKNLIAESEPEEYSEDYQLPYQSVELLSFTYASTLYPAGGRPQFAFEGTVYDLKTGEPLGFNELVGISLEEFKDVFTKKGYWLEELSIADTPFVQVAVAEGMDDPDEFIRSLYAIEDAGCVAYYLEERDSAVHLMFTYKCNGPSHFTFGIDLNDLRPWLLHPVLRNMYRNWGEDIFFLKGTILPVKTDQINFDQYTAYQGGGYILASGDTTTSKKYFITYWNTDAAVFYVLERAVSRAENEKRIILDVLEIKKTELAEGRKIVEGCETSAGQDAEIIALVKDEKNNPSHYKKVIQAWRANRTNGKFETVDRKKIKSCANESDGI